MPTKQLNLTPDQLYGALTDLIQLNELNLRLFEMDGMDTEYAVCSALMEFQQLLVDSCFEDVH